MSKFGTVLLKEGNFFVEFEGKQELLPVSKANAPQVKELVGKKVEVLLSEPQTFIAGLVLVEEKPTFKRIQMTCNVPPPPFLTAVIDERARVVYARQMLEEKRISQETYDKIAATGTAGPQKVAE
jgi:hypothetical protein